jgi:hypothetical protein
MFPACCFKALLYRFPARAAFCSTACHGFDPATGDFNAQTRCLKTIQHSRFLLGSPLPVGAFLPLRIRAFNPIRSRANSLSGSARFPFAPRNRFSLNYQFRINVPGPLRFRKPAVPQTSWNLLHNAPGCRFRQIDSASYLRISSHRIEVCLHADSGPTRCICCG